MIANKIMALSEDKINFKALIDENFVGATLPTFLSRKCDVKKDYEPILQFLLHEFNVISPDKIVGISLIPVRSKELLKIQNKLSSLSSPNKSMKGCATFEVGKIQNNKYVKMTYNNKDFSFLMHKQDLSVLKEYLSG